MPAAFRATPSAERYVLQADALRRRQLGGALLYGSGRSWRRRQRVWPAVVAGLVVVAIVLGGITVAGAFQRQRELDRQEKLQQETGGRTAPGGGF
ncbi:hypothetical protein [Actinomadura algeriensis]|uniref:Uncharacterized protein n=1 Tax=Actinomadura algeriensis TaxID=1679523 RepID=A0ABR9JPS0_9ACTN|nr:hypothetical protein [Actinomadura algeriensis]MBE1532095.1 hypothetical protein [Actinomadura algeriensis]